MELRLRMKKGEQAYKIYYSTPITHYTYICMSHNKRSEIWKK